MFNFTFVRMAGALKIYLHPNMLSSILVKKFFEWMKNILENVKIFILVVNKSISYLLFRVYSMEELMIKVATTTATTRMERSESVSDPSPKRELLGQGASFRQGENYSWIRLYYSFYNNGKMV